MTVVNLEFSSSLSKSDPQKQPVIIIGQLKNLIKAKYSSVKAKLEPHVTEQVYSAALSSLHPSPTDSCSLYLNLATVAALPVKCSRHNTPSRAHFITKLVKSATVGVDESVVIVCRREDVFASACAVARAYPLYSRKTTNNLSASTKTATVQVEFVLLSSSDDTSSMAVSNGTAEGELVLGEGDIELLKNVAMAVRLAARIVDTPCNEMNVDTFVQEVLTVGQALGVKSTVIRGEELNDKGLGGIYGVGKAALVPPALVVLSHLPQGATETIAWVGKGIVYDTGGLSIKGKVITTQTTRQVFKGKVTTTQTTRHVIKGKLTTTQTSHQGQGNDNSNNLASHQGKGNDNSSSLQGQGNDNSDNSSSHQGQGNNNSDNSLSLYLLRDGPHSLF